MGTKRYELAESEWERIKDMLPPEHPKEGKRGRPAKCDNRTALNGMLWIARGGAPWRELPERYGPWQTVYSRFRKWKKLGVLEAIFQALTIDADFENISIDSTSCKVHQSANGGEKSENKAVGMSRGGRNTKIHTLVDGLGNPLAFILSLPAEIMIPPMLYRCSRRSTSREVTSLEIRHTEHKRSASILHPKGPPIPFHPERTAILLGRWTGTHIKSAI